jgi:hypothetical protein
MKHVKRAVSFRLKKETCETACFAPKQKFKKQQVCLAKHKTFFFVVHELRNEFLWKP